jgi:GNAT superfamily N-acetyltransferase
LSISKREIFFLLTSEINFPTPDATGRAIEKAARMSDNVWALANGGCKVMNESLSQSIRIRQSGPGDAGYVACMHGRYYCKRHGFFGKAEYYFIKYLADFVLNPEGGRLWIAEADGNIAGSAAIVRVDDKTAQFRWFLIDENYQNMGIGSRLMKTALDFCRENNYENIFLWTFKGLDTARRLYNKAGFILTEEKANNEWSSVEIIEQKMELNPYPA